MRDAPRQTLGSRLLWLLAIVIAAALAAWDANDVPEESASPPGSDVEEVEIIWNYDIDAAAEP